jgi:O-antigen ligase
MEYLIFVLLIALLIFSLKNYSGIYITYIVFFQSLNKSIFEEVGLDNLRYSTFLILFPIFIYYHSKKLNLLENFNKFKKNGIYIGYLILLFYILVHSLYTSLDYEITYLLNYIIPWLILFFIIGLCIYDKSSVDNFFYGFIILSFINFTFLYLVKDFSTSTNVDRLDFDEVFGFGAIEISRIAGLASLFVFVFIVNHKNRLIQLFSSILLIFFLYQMTKTGTRGPFLAILVSIFLYFGFSKISLSNRISFVVFLLTFILAIIYFGFTDSLLFERGSELFEQDNIESLERYARYFIFLKLLPDHFILGIGPGGWPIFVNGDVYPHNIVLEVIIEFGIIGIISFLLIFWNSLKIIIKNLRSTNVNPVLKGISIGWIFFFITYLLSSSISGSAFFTYSALLAGIHVQNIIVPPKS